MATALPAVQNDAAALVEQVVVQGDLSKLNPTQRVMYYRQVCESLGLNWLTKPFDYINLQGKLVLYAKRDAADQLRKIHGISIQITARERMDDIYVVTARGTAREGRADESIGAVSIKGLSGDNLANAFMKAETKAKRRVTLSLAGLGWLDETETETVQGAAYVPVDHSTGEMPDPKAHATAGTAFAGIPTAQEESGHPDPPAQQQRLAPPQKAGPQQPDQSGSQRRQNPESVITDGQRRRLYAISQDHEWPDSEAKALLERWGYKSSAEVKVKDYDAIIAALEEGPPPADDPFPKQQPA